VEDVLRDNLRKVCGTCMIVFEDNNSLIFDMEKSSKGYLSGNQCRAK
jgi:hypothetical protein